MRGSFFNEVVTVGGKVRAGPQAEAIIKATEAPAHLPLSGRTMEFDSHGMCVACR